MQRQQDEEGFFGQKSVRLVAIAIVGIFAVSVVRLGVSVWLMAQERDKLANKLVAVQRRADERSTQLEALQTPAGVEKALRSAFNIKKPSEQTIVILDPTPTMSSEQKNSRGWWENIKKWLTPKQ